MDRLPLVRALTRDRTHSLLVYGQHSNPLSHLARAVFCILILRKRLKIKCPEDQVPPRLLSGARNPKFYLASSVLKAGPKSCSQACTVQTLPNTVGRTRDTAA